MEEAKKMEKWMGRIQPYTGIQISSHLKVPNSVWTPGSWKLKARICCQFYYHFSILEILPLNQWSESRVRTFRRMRVELSSGPWRLTMFPNFPFHPREFSPGVDTTAFRAPQNNTQHTALWATCSQISTSESPWREIALFAYFSKQRDLETSLFISKEP